MGEMTDLLFHDDPLPDPDPEIRAELGDVPGPGLGVICRHCQTAFLRWVQAGEEDGGGWRLADREGRLHACPGRHRDLLRSLSQTTEELPDGRPPF